MEEIPGGGGGGNMLNDCKPTTVLINSTKASFAELWSTITTTWDSEPRTWDATGSLFVNPSKPTTSFSNEAKPV